MDPNTLLRDILDSLNSGECCGIGDQLRDLADWIDRGGFTPKVHWDPERRSYLIPANGVEDPKPFAPEGPSLTRNTFID